MKKNIYNKLDLIILGVLTSCISISCNKSHDKQSNYTVYNNRTNYSDSVQRANQAEICKKQFEELYQCIKILSRTDFTQENFEISKKITFKNISNRMITSVILSNFDIVKVNVGPNRTKTIFSIGYEKGYPGSLVLSDLDIDRVRFSDGTEIGYFREKITKPY